ncbi:hypothetical protein PHYC_03216 [Phycisphaerales bacterium]|nr:hypothetical protein PHYC_03216 [Phycisphaerales bacterium]
MDAQNEFAKFKILLFVFVLFIASGIASCHELRYLAFGKSAQAQCQNTEVIRRRGRYGIVSHELRVRYAFDDGSLGSRKEEDYVSVEWSNTVQPGAPVAVQYIPGVPERSRLKGHNYAWLTIPFAVCTLALAGFSVYFWRDYKDHERRVRRSHAR